MPRGFQKKYFSLRDQHQFFPNSVRGVRGATAQFESTDPGDVLLPAEKGATINGGTAADYPLCALQICANDPSHMYDISKGRSGASNDSPSVFHLPRGWKNVAQYYRFYRVNKCRTVITLSYQDFVPFQVSNPNTALLNGPVNPIPILAQGFPVAVCLQKSTQLAAADNAAKLPNKDNDGRYFFRELDGTYSHYAILYPGEKKRFTIEWRRGRDTGDHPESWDRIASWDPLCAQANANNQVPGSGIMPVRSRGLVYQPDNTLKGGDIGTGGCFIYCMIQALGQSAYTSNTGAGATPQPFIGHATINFNIRHYRTVQFKELIRTSENMERDVEFAEIGDQDYRDMIPRTGDADTQVADKPMEGTTTLVEIDPNGYDTE